MSFLPRNVLAASLLLVASCSRTPQTAGPNVLLVTLDTLRADHLGCYGAQGAETPSLDAIAQAGVRFDSVTAAAPLTFPAHATLLSGMLPVHHGVHQNGGGAFPDTLPTLATRLHDAGYDTGAFVGAFVLDHRFGLGRGFSVYDDVIPRGPGKATLEAERPGSAVVESALSWLGRPRSAPFFAWVHLYDAHAPYDPPEPFRSRHASSPYAGEVAGVDALVGRLIGALGAAGVLDHTLVVVVADHGEALGEHGELTHGLLLYEPTLRVPLLIRAPGVILAGSRVAEPVSAADLAPTILGFVGQAAINAAPQFDGRDLSPFLRRGEAPPRTDLYAETEYPRLFGWGALHVLRRGDIQLVSGPRSELYDLAHDAAESRDLVVEQPRAAAALETTLASLRKESETTVQTPSPATPDAETRAKLQSLGYAAGAPAPAGSGKQPSPQDMAPLFRRFEEAHQALAAGDAAKAASTLRELVAADAANAVFTGALAEALHATGDLAPAIAAYRRATELSPSDGQAWYNLGVALREAGRLQEATAALLEALRRDPRDAEAQNGLGIAESMRGDAAAAEAAFARALELDPQNAVTANNLGNALRAQGRLDEAAAAYQKALTLSPDYADALNGWGALEVGRQRPAAGVPMLERALVLAPGKHEIQLNLAVAYELLGDAERARRAYSDFIAATASDPQFQSQRSAARQRLQSLEAARAAAPSRR